MRLLLETKCARSAWFVTLTFDDPGLGTLQREGIEKLVARALNSMRKFERRAGNVLPVRFFAVLEFGETFGRPHVHMLVFNSLFSGLDATYRKGVPGPRVKRSWWPHGHIELGGPVTAKSARYVASYVTEFRVDGAVKMFTSRRPGIGYAGVCGLVAAVKAAAGDGVVPFPNCVEIGNRKFPMGHSVRSWFRELFKANGVRCVMLNPVGRKLEAIAQEMANAVVRDPVDDARKAAERDARSRRDVARKDSRERRAVEIALRQSRPLSGVRLLVVEGECDEKQAA